MKGELSNNLDGSENNQIKVRRIEDYTIVLLEKDRASGSEDKFNEVAEVDEDNNGSSFTESQTIWTKY